MELKRFVDEKIEILTQLIDSPQPGRSVTEILMELMYFHEISQMIDNKISEVSSEKN